MPQPPGPSPEATTPTSPTGVAAADPSADGPPSAPAPPTAPAPARLAIRQREFTLTLSRPQIAPGAAIVEVQNGGEDPHDLAVLAGDGSTIASVGEVRPGAIGDLRLTLAAGTYRLICSLPGHEAAGMRATLRVG